MIFFKRKLISLLIVKRRDKLKLSEGYRRDNDFQIKDLGTLKYFLGMEFPKSKSDILVNQRKYILDLLKETDLLGCRVPKTPIE